MWGILKATNVLRTELARALSPQNFIETGIVEMAVSQHKSILRMEFFTRLFLKNIKQLIAGLYEHFLSNSQFFFSFFVFLLPYTELYVPTCTERRTFRNIKSSNPLNIESQNGQHNFVIQKLCQSYIFINSILLAFPWKTREGVKRKLKLTN